MQKAVILQQQTTA